jgi:hypothetical protein
VSHCSKVSTPFCRQTTPDKITDSLACQHSNVRLHFITLTSLGLFLWPENILTRLFHLENIYWVDVTELGRKSGWRLLEVKVERSLVDVEEEE